MHQSSASFQAPRDEIPQKKPEYYTGSGTKFKSYSPYKNTQSNPSQASIDFNKEILRGSIISDNEAKGESLSTTSQM